MARLNTSVLLLVGLCLMSCLSPTVDPLNDGGADGGLTADNRAPTFDLLLPFNETRVAIGVRVQLLYVDDDPDDDATTDLYADIDGELSTTDDQRVIALARPDSNGLQQDLLWQTQGIAPGIYRVIARTRDGTNPPLVSVGRGSIVLVDSPVVLDNLQSGAELRYDTAYLSGSVKGTATEILVERGGQERSWPVISGRFKALVPLALGNNEINFTVGDVRQNIFLRYALSTNRRFVRFVYMLSADGDGQFDAPAGEPHDLASAVNRVKTAARLMQTMFAEKINAQGLGRRTFRVETDPNGEPLVRVIRSSLTTANARAMDGATLYDRFQADLATQPSRADSIDVVIAGMTHFDPAQQTTLAHGANFGPTQIMFGSSTLHTWAASLSEVVQRWTDVRTIDATALRDDSVGRKSHWANYATGLGVLQWMLGTAFGLDESNDPTSLMYFTTRRNFDLVNRTFMMREPPSAITSGISPLLPAQEIGLDKSSAVFLRFHRWMALTDISYTQNTPPTITVNGTGVTVSSSAGLRLVSYYPFVAGAITAHEELLGTPPPNFSITFATLRTRFPGESSIEVSAMDDQGNLGRSTISIPP